MKKLLLLVYLGLLVVSATVTAADDWLMKEGDFTLPHSLLDDVMQARDLTEDSLVDKQRTALLQELFIRENLLAQQGKVSASALNLLEKKLADDRKSQLSRLVLDALSRENEPDFSPRAVELYEVRKDSQYQLPLRLRVRVVQKKMAESTDGTSREATAIATLEDIRRQIEKGTLDFKDAVLQYSDASEKNLTAGDSFWFHQGQKPEGFYQVAQGLSVEKPLSSVFVDAGSAYLLQFIGRQEAMQQTYAEVKDTIQTELAAEYRQQQRKIILEGLRTRFQEDVSIHPVQ